MRDWERLMHWFISPLPPVHIPTPLSLSIHHHKTSQTSWWYSNAVQKHSLLLTYAFMPDITTCTRCIKVLSHLLFQRHLKDATRKRSRQTDLSLLDKKELLYNQSVIAMFIFSIFFFASETLHHKAMSILLGRDIIFFFNALLDFKRRYLNGTRCHWRLKWWNETVKPQQEGIVGLCERSRRPPCSLVTFMELCWDSLSQYGVRLSTPAADKKRRCRSRIKG